MRCAFEGTYKLYMENAERARIVQTALGACCNNLLQKLYVISLDVLIILLVVALFLNNLFTYYL